jgi:hypothetical protein
MFKVGDEVVAVSVWDKKFLTKGKVYKIHTVDLNDYIGVFGDDGKPYYYLGWRFDHAVVPSLDELM